MEKGKERGRGSEREEGRERENPRPALDQKLQQENKGLARKTRVAAAPVLSSSREFETVKLGD